MRIITGSAKGTSLHTPKSQAVIRPALAQVREAIFSSLGDITDWDFVDLFAGTGSLGLEALSRGASFCTFVDIHPESLKLLRENIQKCQFAQQTAIAKLKLPFDLKRLRLKKVPHVIFCDPPYEKNLVNPCLREILKLKLLDENTWLLVEHTKREMPETEGFALIKQKKFGQTLISYLKLAKTGDK